MPTLSLSNNVSSSASSSASTSSYSGVFDLFDGGIFGWSFRRLTRAWTSALITARQGSEEADIGGNEVEVGDIEALISSGEDAQLVRFYDQKGGRDLEQGTNSLQPLVAYNGSVVTSGQKVAVKATPNEDISTSSNVDLSGEGEIWIFFVIDINDFDGDYTVFSHQNLFAVDQGFEFRLTGGGFFSFRVSDIDLIDFPADLGRSSYALNLKNPITQSDTRLFRNGVLVSSEIISTQSISLVSLPFNLFSGPISRIYFLGKAQELLIFTGDKSSEVSAISQNQLNAFPS